MLTFKTAAAAVTMLTLLAFAHPTTAQTLRIYHIDVDQGDATLLVAPNGQSLLVDSGRNGHGPRLLAVMQAAGVTVIDNLVTTHYHDDHYGGIDEVVGAGITIRHVFDRGDKTVQSLGDKLTKPRFREYEDSVGHRADALTRGETVDLDPTMTIRVISSGGVVLGEQNHTTGHDENDMSVTLLIQFGDFRYFIGGDAETATETKIAERDLVVDVDMYQANHHGADNGSSQVLLDDMRPTAIVISNGNHHGHEHPRQSTLTRMGAVTPTPTVFQTNSYIPDSDPNDDGGNVPQAFIADLQPSGPEGTILTTVDRAAGSYTMAYRNESHTFQIKQRGAAATVVIASLVPNPVGADRELEEVVLRNDGAAAADLTAWVLEDASGRVWTLAGVGQLAAGQTATVMRAGMPMSLNNTGDTIVLRNDAGQAVDSVTYTATGEGVRVTGS
jgi:beta-lactamase superfamily II metal-dependent hydrolase